MVKIQFPQINRRITATVYLGIFLLILGTNIWHDRIFTKNREKTLRLSLLRNSTNSFLHEKLGQLYLSENEKASEREYLLAQQYYQNPPVSPDSDVLGLTSNPWQTWQKLIAKKRNLDIEINYWEKVNSTYPDYLYSLSKLAVLHWEKKEPQKAKDYIGIVLTKDPANQTALKLTQKIK